jgi:radical SAM superfamily enzyme
VAGCRCGIHLILGLPGEDRQQILNHARNIAALPVTTIKLHQLQLIRNTKMAQQFTEHPEWFHFYTIDEYIDLCIDFIELLPPHFVLERFVSQSPKALVIAPDWRSKNNEFMYKLNKRIAEREACQGRLFS